MNKMLIKLALLAMLSILLIAANPWLARFTVINQTDAKVYIILQSEDHFYPQLTAKPAKPDAVYIDLDELQELQTSRFTMERDVYHATVHACGVVAEGKIDLTRNLRLNFTPCEDMLQYTHPRYMGEPSMEKPNWFLTPGLSNWRFVYSKPDLSTFNQEPATPGQE